MKHYESIQLQIELDRVTTVDLDLESRVTEAFRGVLEHAGYSVHDVDIVDWRNLELLDGEPKGAVPAA